MVELLAHLDELLGELSEHRFDHDGLKGTGLKIGASELPPLQASGIARPRSTVPLGLALE